MGARRSMPGEMGRHCSGLRRRRSRKCRRLQTDSVLVFSRPDDPAVRVGNSRLMIESLKKAGGDPKYTEYPGVQHNCWDLAYSSDDLWNWLWDQRRK